MSHFTSVAPEGESMFEAQNLDDLEDLLGQLAEDEVQNLLDEMASDPDDVHLPASVRNSYRYSTTTFTIFVYNVCLLFPGFCLHYFCLLLTPIDATRPPPVL